MRRRTARQRHPQRAQARLRTARRPLTANARLTLAFTFALIRQAYGYIPNAAMPNTFLATTVDLGDALSPFGAVHTRYKSDVSFRLGQGALRTAYGDAAAYGGPRFSKALMRNASSGVEVTLMFNDTGSEGLELRPMNISKVHDQARAGWPADGCASPMSPKDKIACQFRSGHCVRCLRLGSPHLASGGAWHAG